MENPNRRGDDRAPLANINVTPLVDVMLVLLIIFMVTASMGQQGINVNLPKADAPPLAVNEDVITVSIDDKLQVYVNDKAVALNNLTETLRAIYAKRSNKSVFLKSDRAVAYGDFVNVVARIKASGVQQLGMLTEPVTQP